MQVRSLQKKKKRYLDFSVRFWIVAESKLCDQQEFMILTHFEAWLTEECTLHRGDELLNSWSYFCFLCMHSSIFIAS